MALLKQNYFKKIKYLYLQRGWSAREIAEEFNVTLDAIYYFLRKNNIPRRNQSEQNKIRFLRKPPSFRLKKNLTLAERNLKIIGIMLYWSEGSQWSGEQIVDFTNSNPEMISLFLQFLRKICGVDEKRLHVYLYCYSNQKPKQLINFWSHITKIPKKQFTKPYVRYDFRKEKEGKMKYGLVHIRYGDKKLLFLIRQWIKDIVKKFG